MSFLEDCVVSRKTPRDGKLEISPASLARLAPHAPVLALVAPSGAARARITSMECTCARGRGTAHVHHFLESPLLAALVPGTEVRLLLDTERATVHVRTRKA